MKKRKKGTPVPTSPITASTSPFPAPTKVSEVKMDFYAALKKVMGGKKITRIEWSEKCYGFLSPDGLLSIHRNLNDHNWIVSDGDILAEDWIIVS